MLTQAEAVVRRERDGGPAVVETEHRTLTIKCTDRSPLAGRFHCVESSGDEIRPDGHRHTSSIDTASTSTIRSISTAGEVSIGMRTTTSPSGRIKTPRL